MSAVLDNKHRLVGKTKSLNEQEKEKINKTLTQISKQTLNKLNKHNVPVTPENFKIYFDTQLENLPAESRKAIEELLALEAKSNNNHTASLEKDIHNAFIFIKSMTESVAHSYKVLNQILKITKQKRDELKQSQNGISTIAYEETLEGAIASLQKDIKSIKDKYNSTAQLIKDFNQKTIFDKKYGIYNKKYLLKSLDSILESIKAYEHNNTLLAIRVKPALLKDISTQAEKNIILGTLAKLLYRRSRRSDIVSHYENGIFMIILKHTTMEEAQIAIERIAQMVESSNFIIEGRDINLKLDFGLASIDNNKTKEEIIIEAVDNL